MIKRLTDNFAINDQVLSLVQPKRPIIQGVVCIKDEKGNILLTKKNIISYRGRVWTLEKLLDINVLENSGGFNIPVTDYNKMTGAVNIFSEDENMYVLDNTTKPCSDLNSQEAKSKNFKIRLFSVGDGGCQRDTDATILPFNRLPPNTFDNDVYNPIFFKDNNTFSSELNAISTKNGGFGGLYKANSNGEWQFKKVNAILNDQGMYDVADPKWHLSVTNYSNVNRDTVEELKFSHEYAAVRYDLEIKKDDLIFKANAATSTTTSQTYDVPVVNELGLYLCDNNYENIEMFSHVTFDSISFRDYKSLKVEYYLFV